MALPANWTTSSSFPASAQNAVEAQVNANTTNIAANTAQINSLLGGGPITIDTAADFGFCQSEFGHEAWTGFGEPVLREVLSGIVASGATRIRFSAWWGAVEPVLNGGYDWDGLDRALNLCEEYGIEPVAVITSPGPPTGGTPTATDYGQLCGAIATRYGSDGTDQLHNYEIWNEFNHPAYADPFNPTPAAYAPLLTAASNAIRAADSDAFIISVGLMAAATDVPGEITLPSTFLQGVYDLGVGDKFDAVGYHWYSGLPGFAGFEEPTEDQYFYVDLLACRDIMVAEGDADKKIWITEMGFPEPELTPQVRAEWQAKQIEMLGRLEWVETFFIYNYRCGNASLTGEAQFGMTTFAGEKRQPYWDYVASINSLVKKVAEDSVTDEKIPDGGISGSKLAVSGAGGATKFLQYGADGTLTSISIDGEGGGPHDHDDQIDITWFTDGVIVDSAEGMASSNNDTSIPTTAAVLDAVADLETAIGAIEIGEGQAGYRAAVGAVAADGTATINHNLGLRSVNAIVKRTYLPVESGLTDTEPGDVIGVAWSVVDDDNIALKPSAAWAANEFIVTVAPTGVVDMSAPTVGTLSSPGGGVTSIDLSISGSSGHIATEWYRDGVLIATTTANTYTDIVGTGTYDYTAQTINLEGRKSSVSNEITETTTGGVSPDTVGAGNRVTGTNTISASQPVTSGSNRRIIAIVVFSQTNWFDNPASFSGLTLTSSLGTAGTPAAMTKLQSQTETDFFGGGQSEGSIHMFDLDDPQVGTHSLALSGVPSGVGTAAHIMIFSCSYHGVGSVSDLVSAKIYASASAVSQTVTADVGDMAVCGIVSPTALTGFNHDSVTNGASVAGSGDYGLMGHAVGEVDTVVSFTTSSSQRHAFLGARLVQA